ncbi:hypothetical protein [Ignatzschineria sp. LJL83]
MVSVIFGFLVACLLACAVTIISALILNFILGCCKVLLSLSKKGEKEFFSVTQVITGALIIVAIIIASLLSFTEFSPERAVGTGVLLAGSIIYILILIYIINVDIKIGKERRIEWGTLATLILVFISIITLIWDDIIDDKNDLLDVASTIATIFAVELALLGFMIAFLSHKRKSGIYIECGIYLKANALNSRILDVYFTNLKDRAVVIYDYVLEIKNVEIKRFLEKPIILDGYNAKVDSFDCSLFFYKQAIYNQNNKQVRHTNFIQTALDVDFSDRVRKFGSDKYSSDRLLHPLICDITNGMGVIRARTNHGIKIFKTRREDRLENEKEMVLYPYPELVLEKEMREMERVYPEHYATVVKRFNKNQDDNKIDHFEKVNFIEFSENALRRKDDFYEIVDLGFGTSSEKEKR